MPKRKPIDYTPQFGSGIFRPKGEVESERTAIDTVTSIPLPAEKEKKEETPTSKNISNSNCSATTNCSERHIKGQYIVF